MSSTAIHGRNVLGRLELEAARLDDVHVSSGVESSDLRAERHADVAADQHLDAAASSMRPTSVVVVDLPLVPVIGDDAARAASATPAPARR